MTKRLKMQTPDELFTWLLDQVSQDKLCDWIKQICDKIQARDRERGIPW